MSFAVLLVSFTQSQSNRDDIEVVKWDEFFQLEKLSKGKPIQTIFTPPVEYQRVHYITITRVQRNTVGLSSSSCALTW
jgi:hypothetical protein